MCLTWPWNLVKLLGAMPLLMDTAEADGIFSAMHILPQLAAAALLDTTVDQPGWQEARKLAGRPYATVTAGVAYHDDVALAWRELLSKTVRMLCAC